MFFQKIYKKQRCFGKNDISIKKKKRQKILKFFIGIINYIKNGNKNDETILNAKKH